MAKRQAKPIADQLRELLEASGLSDSEMERATGVSRVIVWRFRRSERDITLDTAGKLCEALGVEPLRVRRGRWMPDAKLRKPSTSEAANPDVSDSHVTETEE